MSEWDDKWRFTFSISPSKFLVMISRPRVFLPSFILVVTDSSLSVSCQRAHLSWCRVDLLSFPTSSCTTSYFTWQWLDHSVCHDVAQTVSKTHVAPLLNRSLRDRLVALSLSRPLVTCAVLVRTRSCMDVLSFLPTFISGDLLVAVTIRFSRVEQRPTVVSLSVVSSVRGVLWWLVLLFVCPVFLDLLDQCSSFVILSRLRQLDPQQCLVCYACASISLHLSLCDTPQLLLTVRSFSSTLSSRWSSPLCDSDDESSRREWSYQDDDISKKNKFHVRKSVFHVSKLCFDVFRDRYCNIVIYDTNLWVSFLICISFIENQYLRSLFRFQIHIMLDLNRPFFPSWIVRHNVWKNR